MNSPVLQVLLETYQGREVHPETLTDDIETALRSGWIRETRGNEECGNCSMSDVFGGECGGSGLCRAYEPIGKYCVTPDGQGIVDRALRGASKRVQALGMRQVRRELKQMGRAQTVNTSHMPGQEVG